MISERSIGQDQRLGASAESRPSTATVITRSQSVSSERTNWSCQSETWSATILTTASWAENAAIASTISPTGASPASALAVRSSVMALQGRGVGAGAACRPGV